MTARRWWTIAATAATTRWCRSSSRASAGHEADTGPNDDVEAEELNVLAFRDVSARETWVAIASDRQKVEVTLESAVRLHAALGVLLGRATAMA